MTAGKTGYLVMEYGQQRAFERGTPLTLADGETLEKIDITLPQNGDISGRFTDENGDPVEGAMVELFQVRFADGRRQLVPVPASPSAPATISAAIGCLASRRENTS